MDATPHGHLKATTFVAGLRSTGFVAPLVLDGPIYGGALFCFRGRRGDLLKILVWDG